VTAYLDMEDGAVTQRSDVVAPEIEALPPRPDLEHTSGVPIACGAAHDQPPERLRQPGFDPAAGRLAVVWLTFSRHRGEPTVSAMRDADPIVRHPPPR
jgi:hypothetical protein